MRSTTRSDLAGVTALLAVLAGTAQGACVLDRVDLRGDWGRASFRVEIADDGPERAKGLMLREHLDRNAGMLFLYETPQSVSFWMHDTLIPLDMVFIGPDGVVTSVHAEAKPLDETPIPGGDGVLGVLEIAGGLAGKLGIAPGTEVRHPGFGAAAAWPCD
ncbi:MAG: DUF192 domain-containing protein [Mangrovicoccus sp.]|nr:DUF192 domain-containing protein [Mangrovicoccus sp.]